MSAVTSPAGPVTRRIAASPTGSMAMVPSSRLAAGGSAPTTRSRSREASGKCGLMLALSQYRVRGEAVVARGELRAHVDGGARAGCATSSWCRARASGSLPRSASRMPYAPSRPPEPRISALLRMARKYRRLPSRPSIGGATSHGGRGRRWSSRATTPARQGTPRAPSAPAPRRRTTAARGRVPPRGDTDERTVVERPARGPQRRQRHGVARGPQRASATGPATRRRARAASSRRGRPRPPRGPPRSAASDRRTAGATRAATPGPT